MAHEEYEQGDELLDRAAADLKSRGRPGPSPQLDTRTVAALAAAERRKRWFVLALLLRGVSTKTRLRIGLAAVLLVAAAATWLVAPWGSSVALANVLNQARGAQSVKYNMTMTMALPGVPAQKITMTGWMAGGKMRVETSIGQISIGDFQQRKMVMLDPTLKRAVVTDLTGLPKDDNQFNMLDKLLKLDDRAFKPIGEKEIGGRKAHGFEVVSPMQKVVVWADVKTELPVLAEFEQHMGTMPAQTMTMSDFEWNVKIDPAIFSLEVPKGYQIDSLTMDLSAPTEKDFLAGLRAWAELNSSKFPEAMSMEAMWKSMKGMDKRMPAGETPEAKAKRKEMSDKVMKASRAILFVSNPEWSGQDCRYAGAGVALGQADTPVLWYRPKDSAVYHVIYADLSVREAKADELPKVPSKPVLPASIPSTAPATMPS